MGNLSQKLETELRATIKKHNLESIEELIVENSVECFAVHYDRDDDYSTVGNSRFGGDPDLPPDFVWPRGQHPYEDVDWPAQFIAQINFSEIPKLTCKNLLPKEGIVYFFVTYMECAAEPVGIAARYYCGDLSKLKRTRCLEVDPIENEEEFSFKPIRIQVKPSVSIAMYKRSFRKQIELYTTIVDDEEGEYRLYELVNELYRADTIVGQLLGFANAGDIRENLYRQLFLHRIKKRQLIFNDYWDSMQEYEDYIQKGRDEDDDWWVENYEEMREGVTWLMDNKEMISKGVDEWSLLFQLESNRYMDLCMMDSDPLYIFIQDEKLESKDFSDMAGQVTQG